MTLEDELGRLERQVLGVRKVSTFLESVEAIRRLLETHPADVRVRIVKLTAPSLGGDLAAAVLAAFDLGLTGAATAAGIDPPAKAAPAPSTVAAAVKAQRDIADLVAKARKLAAAGVDPEVATSPLFGAANAAKRTVTTLVNQAGNEGVVASASAAKLKLVWVAETNACVHCLAYSGRTTVAGRDWPKGLSYLGSNPYDAPGKCPPLHPNCRCTLEVLNEPSYADALRREADRSVLRGFSLESESMRTRVAAAERLLEQGVDAPKSVIAYARKSVTAGAFTTRGHP